MPSTFQIRKGREINGFKFPFLALGLMQGSRQGSYMDSVGGVVLTKIDEGVCHTLIWERDRQENDNHITTVSLNQTYIQSQKSMQYQDKIQERNFLIHDLTVHLKRIFYNSSNSRFQIFPFFQISILSGTFQNEGFQKELQEYDP